MGEIDMGQEGEKGIYGHVCAGGTHIGYKGGCTGA